MILKIIGIVLIGIFASAIIGVVVAFLSDIRYDNEVGFWLIIFIIILGILGALMLIFA